MMRRLHIGGKERKQGWEVLNALDAPFVDHVCDAGNLGQFADGMFEEIYASHVLEHFDYATTLVPTLAEWLRVLKPGGRLYVSVPDLDVLVRLFVDKESFDARVRYYIMRVIFGGHCDKYDYHMAGLNEEFLVAFLRDAGFVNFRRVSEFDIFDDTSKSRIGDTLISLNMIAERPVTPEIAAVGPREEPVHPPISTPVPDELIVETHEGIRFSVPASLRCFTTYVLLEQERWFEKEADFVPRFLKSGMNAIDIGANLGLYSLAMSQAVGEAGRVFAYEPGQANRLSMENSIRLNGAANITVSSCALSDARKMGWLAIAHSGEYNALVDSAADSRISEAVEVSTLDEQSRIFQWKAMDFVKIDAEGHEARILVGGRNFFSAFSPLVMYEIKDDQTFNLSTRWMFELIGYRSYRLIGDGSFLVPLRSDEAIDAYELNLFSAKADRAASLAQQNLLAGNPEPLVLSEIERISALQRMTAQPYARSLEISLDDFAHCPFADALAAYAAYLYLEDLGVDRRYSALLTAFQRVGEFCDNSVSAAALATYVRVARDLGYRAKALEALQKLIGLSDVELDQPFFPALARFDGLETGESVTHWFLSAVFEQHEFLKAYSSYIHQDITPLKWLCENSTPSAGILRRTILLGLRHGMSAEYLSDCLQRLGSMSASNQVVWGGEGESLAALR